MAHTTRSTVLAATIALIALAAAPAAASDWFGISVSNHGVSLGFGNAGWSLWGSSWNAGGWNVSFNAALSGYGEWVQVGGLGRVWRPWVAADWQPYRHGRWVWTSAGWTWVAYEPWGWIPHHYGGWALSTVGWVWTPGYDYHPGNVVWVRSGGYVGWYPRSPRGWSHAHRGYHAGWRDGYRHGRLDGYANGYDDGWRDARHATWVPWSRVGADNLAYHAVTHGVATRGVPRGDVVALPTAPSRAEVERRVGRSVPEARIVERTANVDGRTVRIARPEGQGASVRRHGAATLDRALAPETRKRHRSQAAARSEARPASDLQRRELESPTPKSQERNRSQNLTRSVSRPTPDLHHREVSEHRSGVETRTTRPSRFSAGAARPGPAAPDQSVPLRTRGNRDEGSFGSPQRDVDRPSQSSAPKASAEESSVVRRSGSRPSIRQRPDAPASRVARPPAKARGGSSSADRPSKATRSHPAARSPETAASARTRQRGEPTKTAEAPRRQRRD